MKLGEIVFYIFICLIIFNIIYKWYLRITKEEKEYNQKLKERLKEEYIYDPETGTKITLEEAESGHWIKHNNLNRVKSQEEINKFFIGREKEAEELINHIKLKKYEFTKLTNSQLNFLDKTKIFEKYNDWSYSNSFSFDNGKNFIFLPAVKINSLHRFQDDYHESQIMFWIKIEKLSGHYYFREKTNFESLTDLIRNDDEIKLNDYECFSFKHSNNKIYLIKLLKLIESEKELEIEIVEENLLIKTLKFPNMEDFLRIENIIKNIC